MNLDEALAEIHRIWEEHDAAVMYLDDAPVLRFMKNELQDDEVFLVLLNFMSPEHKTWFTYYDLDDTL